MPPSDDDPMGGEHQKGRLMVGGLRREEFLTDLVAWLNARVVPVGITVTAETELFEDGLVDSVRILELIAWTERALNQRIPDRMIRMDLFGSAERIADAFLEATE